MPVLGSRVAPSRLKTCGVKRALNRNQPTRRRFATHIRASCNWYTFPPSVVRRATGSTLSAPRRLHDAAGYLLHVVTRSRMLIRLNVCIPGARCLLHVVTRSRMLIRLTACIPRARCLLHVVTRSRMLIRLNVCIPGARCLLHVVTRSRMLIRLTVCIPGARCLLHVVTRSRMLIRLTVCIPGDKWTFRCLSSSTLWYSNSRTQTIEWYETPCVRNLGCVSGCPQRCSASCM